MTLQGLSSPHRLSPRRLLPPVLLAFLGAAMNGTFDQSTGSARNSPQGPWGPVRLQDHGAPVRYRNIWLQPLTDPDAGPGPF